MKKDLQQIRHEYGKQTLRKDRLAKNPFQQFKLWLTEAVDLQLPDANAMTLATVSANGKVSARILLLKDIDETGFYFFTNYNSKKAMQLKANPQAALVFFWPQLERQVRVEGKIEKISASKSDEYFYDRPTGSRIAAAVSPQSQEIENREYLENLIENFKNTNNETFARPDFWGGYRLVPDLFEFWQGRPNRLNDRIEFNLSHSQWTVRRLAP